ncbi:MAG: glycosyl hydrolase 53 family protein [Bacteroidota bacterium]
MRSITFLFCLLFAFNMGCKQEPEPNPEPNEPEEPVGIEEPDFYRGGDLSYVNEMEDCGATYLDENGEEKDPFEIFKEAGTNLIRVRAWHTPDWTNYSTFEDVKKTIRRAKDQGINVLLDLHLSDDWADPGKQKVPAAWLPVVNNTFLLGDSVYNYTYRYLTALDKEGLLPEMVQIGNETNIEILQDPNQSYERINWERNGFLLQEGINAAKKVRQESGKQLAIMLHVAQPENALWFFDEATQNNVGGYDWIGISYYSKWSTYSMENLPQAISTLKNTYNRRVMVVETAYAFTLNNADAAGNIIGSDALVNGYPATEEGQLTYLKDLEAAIKEGGGEGLVYWEPAWVSSSCTTRWGNGSHWDNATLFKQDYTPNMGMSWYSGN